MCGAGLRSFHIDSQGRMTICAMSRCYGYDLKQIRFSDAWEQMGELRKLERKYSTPCQTCTLGGTLHAVSGLVTGCTR